MFEVDSELQRRKADRFTVSSATRRLSTLQKRFKFCSAVRCSYPYVLQLLLQLLLSPLPFPFRVGGVGSFPNLLKMKRLDNENTTQSPSLPRGLEVHFLAPFHQRNHSPSAFPKASILSLGLEHLDF